MFPTTKRLSVLAGTALLGCLSFAGQAQASQITFNFNCIIVNATTCSAGGPFGTLTLTDSLKDANRVDIDVTLNGPNILAQQSAFQGLNNFFLNYGGSVSNGTTFMLVDQNDQPGTFTHSGDVSVNMNNQGPLSTTLDFKLDPVGSDPSLTYSGSLVLRTDNTVTETNLDVSMFNYKDANNLLYAGFDTLPNNNRFFGGSTALLEVDDRGAQGPAAVPEPASFVLLGSGLLAAAHVARRRMLKK